MEDHKKGIPHAASGWLVTVLERREFPHVETKIFYKTRMVFNLLIINKGVWALAPQVVRALSASQLRMYSDPGIRKSRGINPLLINHSSKLL